MKKDRKQSKPPPDFESLFAEARAQNRIVLNRDDFTGEQSRQLTVLAEQQGLVVYKEADEKKKGYLVLTLSRDEPCDPLALSPAQLKAFSDFCDVPFNDPKTLADDMAMFGVAPDTLTSFVDEIRRYGLTGLKRRNIILQTEMVNELQKQPEYKALQANPPERIGNMDSNFSIQRMVYNAANTEKFFFSIDLKAAVFNCYKELNIIKTKTWPEFVTKFTPSVSFLNNKPARLHIFGELDKNRKNIILWNNKLWKVWQNILQHWPEAENKKVAIEGDELVLATSESEIVSDATRLLGECGLSAIPDQINVQCYRLVPHFLEIPPDPKAEKGKAKATQDKFFIRQKFDLVTGKPNGKYDVKCIQRQNRKQAMIASKALLGL